MKIDTGFIWQTLFFFTYTNEFAQKKTFTLIKNKHKSSEGPAVITWMY